MERCLQLANLGAGNVAPNPMVGAILVHNDVIIGEGYHQKYGQAHAEVNCINSVTKNLQDLIPHSTLYVSLEPCNHFGKTPPCSDFIIQHKIKKVVIGCIDKFEKVNGSGIEKLQSAGIEVIIEVLKKKCEIVNKRFFTFHQKQRPFIILKWAQTADIKIANSSKENISERLFITNDFTNTIVHKWRSEEAAILVGTNTALLDNPSLTNRLWKGNNPTRLVIDTALKLPSTLELFNQQQKTIVFNYLQHQEHENLFYYQLNRDEDLIQQIVKACFKLNIQSILVEGGATLLQSFINQNLWDEARIITNKSLQINEGLSAPNLVGNLLQEENYFTDNIQYFIPTQK